MNFFLTMHSDSEQKGNNSCYCCRADSSYQANQSGDIGVGHGDDEGGEVENAGDPEMVLVASLELEVCVELVSGGEEVDWDVEEGHHDEKPGQDLHNNIIHSS